MILEWDVLFELVSSVDAAGTSPGLPDLPLNSLATLGTSDLGYYLLDPAKCVAGAARRITRNNLAQADGEITHRKFKSGYVIELNVQLWEFSGAEGIPACGGVLRQMADTLGEYLEAMSNADGQVIWFPSAWPAGSSAPKPRLLDQARSMGPSGNDASGASFVSVVQEKDADSPLTTVTFAFLSPLPYAMDYMDYPVTPDATILYANGGLPGATVNVTNIGNVDYWPVYRVWGPSQGWTLQNLSVLDENGLPFVLTYDHTLPGAFSIPANAYAEIDSFRNTAWVYQSGVAPRNAKPCIDPANTTMPPLVPGQNDYLLSWNPGQVGTQAEIVYRNAWA